MESRFCTYKRVGYLRERVAYELGIEFTGVIYASPGVLKHIIKRHGRQFDKRTRTGILEWMKKILDDPDYIGIYKNDEGQTAIEFIKKAYTNLLLGVEVDEEKQYIYNDRTISFDITFFQVVQQRTTLTYQCSPVSYTHLDVYKRQAYGTLGSRQISA